MKNLSNTKEMQSMWFDVDSTKMCELMLKRHHNCNDGRVLFIDFGFIKNNEIPY